MGVRERFRLRRKLSSRHIVTAPANPNLPDSSDAPPVAQATNPSLFFTALEERSVVPLDDTQDEPSSRFKLFQGSTYGSGALHESRSSTSGGSSLRLTAKRMGRSIKERILRKEHSISSSDHEAYQAQVPEITEADSTIARYAAECSSPEPLVRSPPFASADVSTLTAHSCGDLAPLGAELPQGAKCNDGCVSFVVPQGWAATRMQDCFCLFTDMAVGYVRTVPANEAAKALASTDRLQVSSAVTATSSPVFMAPDVIQVEYTSPNGTGKGLGKFTEGFNDGACIFALCGPVEMKAMIEQGLQDLMKSVIFMSLYESEETKGFDAPVNVEDVLMFGDEDATATGLMGQCSVQ